MEDLEEEVQVVQPANRLRWLCSDANPNRLCRPGSTLWKACLIIRWVTGLVAVCVTLFYLSPMAMSPLWYAMAPDELENCTVLSCVNCGFAMQRSYTSASCRVLALVVVTCGLFALVLILGAVYEWFCPCLHGWCGRIRTEVVAATTVTINETPSTTVQYVT